jgi:hypothetical protein
MQKIWSVCNYKLHVKLSWHRLIPFLSFLQLSVLNSTVFRLLLLLLFCQTLHMTTLPGPCMENTCHVIATQPVHQSVGCCLATDMAQTYKKHSMWPLLTVFVGLTTDTKKTLLQYCWPCVCCGRYLAMDLHVTINFLTIFNCSAHLILFFPYNAIYFFENEYLHLEHLYCSFAY